MTGKRCFMIGLFALLTLVSGCTDRKMNHRVVDLYYTHQYSQVRELVRVAAEDRNDRNIVINSMRLGIASLADGDEDEAERALLRAYEYLTSGGVNRSDRVVASTLIYEGLKVWTGEPFEQAMCYYYIASLYMVKGDWENGHAAASNALFALRAFKDNHDEQKNRTIESEFALGYLLAGLNAQLMGRTDIADRMFEQVIALNKQHKPLVDAIKQGDYDTILLLDTGRGPIKQRHGSSKAKVRYFPDGRSIPLSKASVKVDGDSVQIAGEYPLVDLWSLSQYPRWWSSENYREARSLFGDVLLWGGIAAAVVGAAINDDTVMWSGVGAAGAGLGTKQLASADPRQLTMLPRCVFIVPLKLGTGLHDVSLQFENEGGSDATWHDLSGGKVGQPAVYYLRMHNAGGRGMPTWPDEPMYTTDVREASSNTDNTKHYLLGGHDLSTPDVLWFDKQRAIGHFKNITYDQWKQALDVEGIVFRPGRQGLDGKASMKAQLYRHIAEGGNVLWTPRPGCHLYERLTRQPHTPYQPASAPLQAMIQNEPLQKMESAVQKTKNDKP